MVELAAATAAAAGYDSGGSMHHGGNKTLNRNIKQHLSLFYNIIVRQLLVLSAP